MFKRIFLYLIPVEVAGKPELLRRYRLILSIIMITVIFDLDYGFTTISIGMKGGTTMLFIAATVHLSLLYAVKRNVPLLVVSNIYVLTGVSAIVVSVFHSGGFYSPVLPWLATSPVMALLMGGRRTGIAWLVINTALILFFSFAVKMGIVFPVNYNLEWKDNLSLNCILGLIMIIFFVSLVFENGKNTAIKRLEEKSLLLSEEKKKNALYQISQEIHDGVGQTLSVIKLNLHLLDSRLEQMPHDHIKETLALAGKAIQDLRNISNNLYAENLSEFDLGNAILEDIEHIRKIGTIKAAVAIKGNPYLLDARSAFILYRVSREATNNALKHSGATSIMVEMDFGDEFSLTVSDDGCGMEASFSGHTGQGMMSMRERMLLLGGSLEVESNPSGGTRLTAKIHADRIGKKNSIELIS
jgi:signal transduction histidine kinase